MTSSLLRRVAALVAILVAPIAMTIVTAPPASADTTCTIGSYDPGFGKYRYCKIDTARPGAKMRGSVTWRYKDKAGSFSFTLTDTESDGKCAWARFISPAGADFWYSACGIGTTEGYERPFTSGPADDGYFKLYLCTGKNVSACWVVWSQDVDQPAP